MSQSQHEGVPTAAGRAEHGTVAPAIQVQGLTKRYRNASVNAVDGVTFDVRAGELFALLGPNGAGKTTTISILTTTLLPTSGRAIVAGYDVVTEPAAVRRRAGIIFQSPSIDPNLTAEENVRLHAILYGVAPYRPTYRTMPAEYRRRVAELGDVLGLGGDLFRPIRTFSGGMKRKLEIVRSLIHRPQVLFLDEPTTGLDPSSRRSLWAYLEDARQREGTTLLLSTHYLEEAEQADRICIISHGRVVSLGSPRQVKADLVDNYLVVDGDDRSALRSELQALGVGFSEEAHVRIPVAAAEVHMLLRRIETPLTMVQTHTPSLEDAYLEIVERPAAEEVVAGPEGADPAGGAAQGAAL